MMAQALGSPVPAADLTKSPAPRPSLAQPRLLRGTLTSKYRKINIGEHNVKWKMLSLEQT